MAQKETLHRESGRADIESIVISLYGPPGAGKTWAALAISHKWPKNMPERTAKSKKVVLDDIVHVGFDPACLAGLVSHNVTVKYAFNFSDIVADYGLEKGTGKLLDDIFEVIEGGKIKAVIHDTITTADRYSLSHWEETLPVNRDGVPDTRKMFGRHLGWHRQYQVASSSMPAGVATVYLFHEKELSDDPGHATRSKALGDAAIYFVPAVTGSGWRFYCNDSSLEMPLIKTRAKQGGKWRTQRLIYPYPYQGYRVKNRFEHILTEPLEPDLGAILRKIQA